MFNNIVLSKDHPTVIYIPIGDMPRGKGTKYLESIHAQIVEKNPDYKVILIGVAGAVGNLQVVYTTDENYKVEYENIKL